MYKNLLVKVTKVYIFLAVKENIQSPHKASHLLKSVIPRAFPDLGGLTTINTQNVESATATTPTPSRFYLIPESDLFGCEIWICSLFYLWMGQIRSM